MDKHYVESVPEAYDGSQKIGSFHDDRASAFEREDAVESETTPKKKLGQEKANSPTLHSAV